MVTLGSLSGGSAAARLAASLSPASMSPACCHLPGASCKQTQALSSEFTPDEITPLDHQSLVWGSSGSSHGGCC